jgi:hypothetical protein
MFNLVYQYMVFLTHVSSVELMERNLLLSPVAYILLKKKSWDFKLYQRFWNAALDWCLIYHRFWVQNIFVALKRSFYLIDKNSKCFHALLNEWISGMQQQRHSSRINNLHYFCSPNAINSFLHKLLLNWTCCTYIECILNLWILISMHNRSGSPIMEDVAAFSKTYRARWKVCSLCGVEQFFAATPWFELLGVVLSSLIHMYEFMVYYATFDSGVLFCFILTVMLNGQTMYLVKLCTWLSFCKRAFALLYYVTFDSSIIFYFDSNVEWICCVMFLLYLLSWLYYMPHFPHFIVDFRNLENRSNSYTQLYFITNTFKSQ